MKTKRTNRLIALVLALVMLASVFTLPAFAEETKEAQVFAEVDFEDAAVNKVTLDPPEGSPEGTVGPEVDGTSITAEGIKTAHPYVSIGQDATHGKYAVIPFRGEALDGTANGSGNYDKSFYVQHPEVSYETTQGVIVEFEIFTHFVQIEGAKDPTVEFQFGNVNHRETGEGKVSTSWITLGQLNLKTGVLDMMGKGMVENSKLTVTPDAWNTIRYEFDLANSLFEVYINGEKYATYCTLGSFRNVVVPAGRLIIAKCNKNVGAYTDKDSEGNAIADTDMTYVAVDNIKFYENVDFVPPPVEELPENAIFYDTYQSKNVGTLPKAFGYTAPVSAIVAADPTKDGNKVIKVDIAAKGSADYYLWCSTNGGKNIPVEPNEGYDPEDPNCEVPKYTIVDGVLTGKTSKGTFTAKIWGDDPNEVKKPTDTDESGNRLGAGYEIEALTGTAPDGKSQSGVTWYFLTGAMNDAIHGAGNVASGLQPKHDAVYSSVLSPIEGKKNLVFNASYYFSADAKGKMEVQLQGTFALKADPTVTKAKQWIDMFVIEAVQPAEGEGYLAIKAPSNYARVCGEDIKLPLAQWIDVTVILDMETGYEDIYFNGNYCCTQRPASAVSNIGAGSADEIQLIAVDANTLSVAKIQRSVVPSSLAGYYLVDNIGFFRGDVMRGSEYSRSYIENFDNLEEGVDFATTTFGTEIPSSVVLAGDATHAKALKMTVGEITDEAVASLPALWSTRYDSIYMVKSYNEEDKSVVIEIPAEEEGGEPTEQTIVPNRKGAYSVGGKAHNLGTYGEYVNYYGKLSDGSAATNLNKNWIFNNPGVSYSLKSRLATDFELYIPEGAAGVVTSQITKGAGASADGNRKNFTDAKVLYSIDLATGNINLGDVVDDENKLGTLNVGAWNNVSLYINLASGEIELYVNNRYVGASSFGLTQLAFYANTWILAKVESGQDALAGYVMIDDVRFFTITDELITVDGSMENVVSVRFGGETVPSGTKLFITDDVRCTCDPSCEEDPCDKYYEEMFDTSAYEGIVYPAYSDDYFVTVRSNRPIGLRFTTQVDLDLLEELQAEYGGTITYGTIIVPTRDVKDLVEEKGAFTRTDLQRQEIQYLDVRTNGFFSNEYLESTDEFDFEGVFAGSIVGLSEHNIKLDFSSVGYVELVLENGGVIAMYTEAVQANLAEHAAMYLDNIDDIPDDIRVVLEAFAIGRYPQGYNDGLRDDVK